MDLDLEAARAAFESSQDFTIGLEEEFAILGEDLELTPRFEELRCAAERDPVLSESISGELICAELEIRSGRGEDFAAAVAQQRDRRVRLFALAHETGVALGSTGTHPWSDYREQPIINTDHYRRVEEGLKYVAWRNNTFSLHVHVGVRGTDRAVQVCDRLRPVLPVLLAVSANSPFLDGRNSGLHSARSQIFTRSFPRCGVPDSFGSWDAFTDYVSFLARTNSIVEYTQLWWSIRPHFSFGTVEVRICDAQMTAAESEALAGLITACVAQAARDHDEGAPVEDLPRRLIDENVWRAVRFGMEGELIDLPSGRTLPATAAAERLLAWCEPMRTELGLDVALPSLNGAQRQRQMIEQGMTLQEAYADTVLRTRDTYAGGVEVER